MELVTGDNKIQFEKWYDSSPMNDEWKVLSNQDSFGNDIPIGVEYFFEHPFEMQIGVCLAYYDSLGVSIEINSDSSKEQRIYVVINRYKNSCQYIFLSLMFKDNLIWHRPSYGVPYYHFETRQEAYKEAFKKANEIVNKEQ